MAIAGDMTGSDLIADRLSNPVRPQAFPANIRAPSGGGKRARLAAESVDFAAEIFCFRLLGQPSKSFRHVEQPGLVNDFPDLLGKSDTFRGIPTVVDR
jgi:hypothetical protein